MAKNLYKLKDGSFFIEWNTSTIEVSTIDQACNSLEDLGVAPNEVDVVATEILVNGNTRAHFGDQDTFLFADKKDFKR